MFNLIITIIAIALVVVLTATSVFYGGDAFSEGSTDAIAATYINQAQQIQGAATLFKAKTGAAITQLSDLDGGYLSSVPASPSGASWTVADGTADTDNALDAVIVTKSASTNNKDGISPEVCTKINENGAGLVTCHVGGDINAFEAGLAVVAGTDTLAQNARIDDIKDSVTDSASLVVGMNL